MIPAVDPTRLYTVALGWRRPDDQPTFALVDVEAYSVQDAVSQALYQAVAQHAAAGGAVPAMSMVWVGPATVSARALALRACEAMGLVMERPASERPQ